MIIDVYLENSYEIDVGLEDSYELDVGMEIGTIITGDVLPVWEGPYSITPRVAEQSFETRNKKMRDDLTIEEIPLQEVLNPQGGTTLIIE